MAHGPVSVDDLRGLGLFAGLPDDELAPVADAARRRSLHDREVLARRGDQDDRVAWVMAGRITLSLDQDGRAVVVMTLGAGDMLGWSLLREHAVSLTTARAVGPAEVVEVPADRVLELATSGGATGRLVVRRLIAAAARDLDATRAQLLRRNEGVISAG